MVREFWIELKNMCAWNIDEKPAAHRECIHVIDYNTHEEVVKMLQTLRLEKQYNWECIEIHFKNRIEQLEKRIKELEWELEKKHNGSF